MTNHLPTVRALYDLIIGGCLAIQNAGLLEVSFWDIVYAMVEKERVDKNFF